MDAFFEHGGRLIDTAHYYAEWHPRGSGMSERTVGAWLRDRKIRDQVILGTKGGHPKVDDLDHPHLSSAELEQDLSESLERLGIEQIDIYWLHMDDLHRSVEEIIETLAAFIQDGRVKRIAASNWTTARIEAANAYAEKTGLSGFVASQPNWSLAKPNWPPTPVPGLLAMDDTALQWHVENHFPVIPYTSQATGYFSERNVVWLRGGFEGSAPLGGPKYDSPLNRQRLRQAASIAEKRGVTANQIALAFLLNQPMPVYPIIGTAKPHRIPEIVKAANIKLSKEELDQLIL